MYVDDRKRNLEQANRLGSSTIWFQVREDAHPFKPDLVVCTLTELLAAVRGIADQGRPVRGEREKSRRTESHILKRSEQE